MCPTPLLCESVKLPSGKEYLNAALRYFVPTVRSPLVLRARRLFLRRFGAGKKKMVC